MFQFDYQLDGTGWSRARIADDTLCATVTASYLSDALRLLLEAVLAIVDGAGNSRCSWDEEPGEFRFLFESQGKDADLRILWFEELWGNEPDENGLMVFETRQPIAWLGRVVRDAASNVLAEWGEEGYERKWVLAPFPIQELSSLTEALESQSPPSA